MSPARVSIVTGAAGGLGSAVTALLTSRGDTVVAVDINPERVATDIERNANIYPMAASLDQWAECERVVAETISSHGRVDVLVNCAAILERTELDEVDPDVFARIFNTNCRSVFVLSRAALRDMEQRSWGRIVNVTSVGVHIGGYSLTSAVYEASKAAVTNFTKTLARYAGPRGILVNAVAPGGMRTPMLTQQTPPELLAQVEADIPLGRLAEPSEIAHLVAHLAGPDNSYASGATFDVNGGVVTP